MLVKKAYRFRLEPNQSQVRELLQYIGCCRFVWNWMLEQRKAFYKTTGEKVALGELDKQLSPLKKHYPWLKDCPSQSLQQSLQDLDKAYRNMGHGNHYPNRKKRGVHDSIRLMKVKVVGNYVRLPKLGEVKFRLSQEIKGEVKNATVTREGEHWYISFPVDEEINLAQAPSSEVGIDLGVKKLLTLSTGEQIAPIDFSKEQQKLKKAQRKLSRMKKGSNNWKKQKNRLNRKHRKISNKRRDYLHKASTTISKNHALIYVEDLQIPNMVRSAKGNALEHGKNVKAKSGLNRSILQQGWGEFIRQLSYKSAWRNGSVIKVDPKHTSQTCSECGYTAKENRKTQEVFECVQCGHTENADINASKNILAVGQTVSACGDIRKIAS